MECSDILKNTISSFLDDDNTERFFFIISSKNSYNPCLFNIDNGTAIYDGIKTSEIMDSIISILYGDKENPEFMYEEKQWNKVPGIRFYRFLGKQFVDCQIIEKETFTITSITAHVDISYIVLHKLYNIEPANEKDKKNLENNLKIEDIFNKDNSNINNTGLYFKGVEVIISSNTLDSLKHVQEDFKVLENENYELLLKEKYLPWLKGNDFKEYDDDKIISGLEIKEVEYCYNSINEKYSPTGIADYFGEFVIYFSSCSDYTKDMLEYVAMKVYINNEKIVKISGYDV